MELVWDVSPDFLTRWSPQYRVLTVYPLVSTLLTTDATSASSHSIADRAYRPVVTALQDAYTSTQISTLDLIPLLCFITGQYFSSSFPNPDKYPSNTFSLLTPRTLSSQQCELILRIACRWQSHIPHHDRDRPASKIARHFIDAWYASPEPSTSSGYAPPTTRARSHQRVNGSMIHLRPMSLDSSEASFAGLIPFLISLLHVQRPTAADERRMTQSPSFFYWLRYHLGCPWSAYNGHPLNSNNTDCPRMTSPTRAHVVCGHFSFHTRFNVRCGSFTEFHIPLAPIKIRTPAPDLPYPIYLSPECLTFPLRPPMSNTERHHSLLGGGCCRKGAMREEMILPLSRPRRLRSYVSRNHRPSSETNGSGRRKPRNGT